MNNALRVEGLSPQRETMDKLRRSIQSIFNNTYADVFIIHVVFFLVCLQKNLITYETNDDFYMSALLYGGWTEPTDHLVFINVLLGKFLRLLVSVAPSIAWYYYFQALCCLAAFSCAGIVIKRRSSLVYWLSLPVCLWMIETECYQSMQFTKTAGVMAMAGALLIIDSFETDKGKISQRAAGSLLIFVGSLYRLDPVFVGCGVFFFFVLGQALKNRRVNFSLCAFWAGTLALCMLASFYNAQVYRSDPDWESFAIFNRKRTLLTDWDVADWDDYYSLYGEEYRQAGIDPADLKMMRTWCFTDPEVYNSEFVDKAIAIRKQTMAEYRHSLTHMRNYFGEMYRKISSESLTKILCGLLLIWALVCRKRAVSILGIPLMILSVTLYCYHIDRYWNHRALFSLLCGANGLVMYMLTLSVKRNACPLIKVFSMLLILIFTGAVWNENLFLTEPGQDSLPYTLQKINEQEDPLYMIDPLFNRFHASMDVREPLQKGMFQNICDTGGWLVNSPIVADIFQAHNVRNPWHECIDSENIYFLDFGRFQDKLDFIRSHYAPNAKAQLISLSSNLGVYRIVTKDVSEDLLRYTDDADDIAYHVECSLEDQKLTIRGNICKDQHVSFDQRVFLKICQTGQPDSDYTVLQVEDWTFPPEDDRHFGGFLLKLDIDPLQSREPEVYLYFKADKLYRFNISEDVRLALMQ